MKDVIQTCNSSIKEIAAANIAKIDELLAISFNANKEADAVITDKDCEYSDKVRILTEVKDRLSLMYTNLYNIKF